MSALDYDLFDLWRWCLAVVCTAYAVAVTARWLWDWGLWLAGGDRTTGLLRKYLLVQLLRLRFGRFGGELLGIAAWAAGLTGLLILDSRWARAG